MDYTVNEFLSQALIKARVAELGKIITEEYRNRELLVVGVLRGSVIFLSDLIREIDNPLEIDFVKASSYDNGTESSGTVKLVQDLSQDLQGRDILIVEDIVDSGRTAKFLMDTFSVRSPASIRLCTLLDKPSRRAVEISADYVGFTIPDEFIVGYGLDYAGKHRGLPYLAKIEFM
jgi:hypoxanthine phosphoribosyltransferase